MKKCIAVGETTSGSKKICNFVDLKTADVQYQYNDTIWAFKGSIDELEKIRGTAAIDWETFFIADKIE